MYEETVIGHQFNAHPPCSYREIQKGRAAIFYSFPIQLEVGDFERQSTRWSMLVLTYELERNSKLNVVAWAWQVALPPFEIYQECVEIPWINSYSCRILVFVVVVQSLSHVHGVMCDSMDCSMPGFLILHHLLELAQTHVHWVSDAIQPPHPLSFPSPTFSLSQHQGLF